MAGLLDMLPALWLDRLEVQEDEDHIVGLHHRTSHPYDVGETWHIARSMEQTPRGIRYTESIEVEGADDGRLQDMARRAARNMARVGLGCDRCGRDSNEAQVVSIATGLQTVLLCAPCLREAVAVAAEEEGG